MKAMARVAAVVCSLLALSVHGQDFAPTSVAGRTAVIVITGGNGIFAPTGAYRLLLSSNGYQVAPLTSNVLPHSGTYTWTKTGANSGAAVIVNAQTGIPATQSIAFLSPTVGTFTTISVVGAQSGSFVWEGIGDVNRFVNIATRGHVGTDSEILIAGFVISGTVPKRVLIRGVGPTLGGPAFGVAGALQDPVLTVFNSAGTMVGQNDNWFTEPQIGATFARVGAFPFGPVSFDSAIVLTLPAGSYTAQVSGWNRTTGVALIEVYEIP